MIRKPKTSLYFLYLLVLFAALNAGIFGLIPIRGLGTLTYLLFSILLFYITSKNFFYIKKFCIPFCLAFVWLLFLFFVKSSGTLNGLYQWFLGGLVVISFNYLDENDGLLSSFVLFTLVLTLFFSLFEMISGFHISLSRYSQNNMSSQTPLGLHIPTFFFVNENDFCSFLILLFFYSRALYKKKRILFDIVVLPYVVLCLWVANARLCLIALSFYYFYIVISKFNKKARFCLYAISAIIFMCICIERIIPVFLEDYNYGLNKSIRVRLNLILIAMENIFTQKQFLGFGAASFPNIVGVDPRTAGIVDPHNFYIELGVEVGLLFLVFYLIFILFYLKYEKDKLFKGLFLVFLITSFCSSRFSRDLWNWFFLALFLKRFFYLWRYKKKKNSCDNSSISLISLQTKGDNLE